jgi:integrase
MARGKRRRLATGIFEDAYGRAIVVKVHGVQHERRYALGTPLEELRKHRRALRDDKADHEPARQQRGTLKDDIAKYLQTLPKGRSRRDAETLLGHWITAGFGDRSAVELDARDIQTQLSAWEGRFSPKTRLELRRLLGSVYIAANGKSGRNPVRDVPRPRVVYDDPRGFSYALVEFVLSHMPDRGQGKKGQPRSMINLTKLRLRVMAYTGLHQIEIGRLTARDLRDLKHKRVWVQGRRKGRGTLAGWHPLTSSGTRALRDLQDANGLGPFGARDMSRSWQRAIDQAKIAWSKDRPGVAWPLADDVRPYDLRHTFATEVYRQTRDIRAAQRLLRNTTIGPTLRYTAAAVDALAQQASNAMEDIHAAASRLPARRGKRLQKAPPSADAAPLSRPRDEPRRTPKTPINTGK